MHLALPSQKPNTSSPPPSHRHWMLRSFSWLRDHRHVVPVHRSLVAMDPVTMPLDKDTESQTLPRNDKHSTPYDDAYDLDELSDADNIGSSSSDDDTLTMASKVKVHSRPVTWHQPPLPLSWLRSCLYVLVFGLYASSWAACMGIVWHSWNRPPLA